MKSLPFKAVYAIVNCYHTLLNCMEIASGTSTSLASMTAFPSKVQEIRKTFSAGGAACRMQGVQQSSHVYLGLQYPAPLALEYPRIQEPKRR